MASGDGQPSDPKWIVTFVNPAWGVSLLTGKIDQNQKTLANFQTGIVVKGHDAKETGEVDYNANKQAIEDALKGLFTLNTDGVEYITDLSRGSRTARPTAPSSSETLGADLRARTRQTWSIWAAHPKR